MPSVDDPWGITDNQAGTPATATTTAPAAKKPAAPKKGFAGFLQKVGHIIAAPYKAEAHIVSAAARDIRNIAAAVPHIPSGIEHAAIALMPNIAKAQPTSEWHSPLQALKNIGQTVAPTGLKFTSQVHPFSEAAQNVANNPVTGLLPGAHTLAGFTTPKGRSDLWEHPLMTGLDVLPIANHLAQAATVGTDAAARAAEEAANTGKLYKAQKITDQGLNLAQAARQGIKTLESKAPPKLQRFMPSEMLAANLSGQDARNFMEKVGPAGLHNRLLVSDAQKWSDEIFNRAKQAGITPDRAVELGNQFERGAPGWVNDATVGIKSPAEAGFVSFYRDKVNEFANLGVQNKTLVNWRGEVYPSTSAIGSRIGKLNRMMTRANAASTPERQAALLSQADKLRGRVEKAYQTVPSARWMPLVQQRITQAVSDVIHQTNPKAAWAELDRRAFEGDFENLPNVPPAAIRRITREQAKTWTDLQNAGYDPIFVHHAGLTRDATTVYPKVDLRHQVAARLPSEKIRSWDPQPYNNDITVALSRDGIDHLIQSHTAAAVQDLHDSNILIPRDAMRARVERLAAAGVGRGTNQTERMKSLIDQDYTPWLLEKGRMQKIASPLANANNPNIYYLPKTLDRIVEVMNAVPHSWLSKANQFQTGLWRFSTFTMSPMFYLHVALGNTLMLAGRTDPTIFRFLRRANAIVRSDESILPELEHGQGTILPNRMLDAVHLHAGGRQIGEILKTMPNGFRNLSGYVHDMTQSMAFLYGKDAAERQGMSPAVARSAGLELAQSVVQRFDRMTPFERNVVRQVLPTYGFMSHILRYSATLPFDHPLRVSILSNFAHNELDDWKQGLPDRFLGWAFVGHINKAGDQYALPMSGLVPFLGEANYFTLAGIMSHVNPFGQALMETFGLDPSTANVKLFGNKTTLDPVTGKEIPVRPNFFDAYARSLFGPIDSLETWFTVNDDLKVLKATNPEAWKRRILSGIGLAFVPTKFNIAKEKAKAAKAAKSVATKQAKEAAYVAKKLGQPAPGASVQAGTSSDNPWGI